MTRTCGEAAGREDAKASCTGVVFHCALGGRGFSEIGAGIGRLLSEKSIDLFDGLGNIPEFQVALFDFLRARKLLRTTNSKIAIATMTAAATIPPMAPLGRPFDDEEADESDALLLALGVGEAESDEGTTGGEGTAGEVAGVLLG